MNSFVFFCGQLLVLAAFAWVIFHSLRPLNLTKPICKILPLKTGDLCDSFRLTYFKSDFVGVAVAVAVFQQLLVLSYPLNFMIK